jgi:hypothetical protein
MFEKTSRLRGVCNLKNVADSVITILSPKRMKCRSALNCKCAWCIVHGIVSDYSQWTPSAFVLNGDRFFFTAVSTKRLCPFGVAVGEGGAPPIYFLPKKGFFLLSCGGTNKNIF